MTSTTTTTCGLALAVAMLLVGQLGLLGTAHFIDSAGVLAFVAQASAGIERTMRS